MELNSDIITIFSLIVSGVLVGIVIFQYRLSLKQYETINRPWLIFEKTNQHIDSHFIMWSLENIGNIPAEKIKITSKTILNLNGEEKIIEDSKSVMTDIIMPKQKFTFVMNDVVLEDLAQCDSIDMNIFISYRFLKHTKSSQFRYYRHNAIDHEEIDCVKAD